MTARFPEELGLPTQPTGSGPSSVYYTTGFSRCEIQNLCVLIEEIQSSIPEADRRDWPPILGLGNSVVITLTYLRRNRVQWELAETYGVSQATVSRAITSITPLPARALARHVPTAEELRPDRQYIVEGTPASLRVMGVRAGPVLGQAQDDRHERPGRVHPRG